MNTGDIIPDNTWYHFLRPHLVSLRTTRSITSYNHTWYHFLWPRVV